MLQDERNPLFLQYLRQHQAELEQQLLYPKNDWRRKIQLQHDLDDVMTRMRAFERRSYKAGRTDRRGDSRYSQVISRGFESHRQTAQAIAVNY